MKYICSKHLVKMKDRNGNTWCYNSIFGGLRMLSDTELNILNKAESNNGIMESADIGSLKDSNFLVTEDYDEYGYIRKYQETYLASLKTGDSITKLLLYVTNLCNLKCKYCYISDAGHVEELSCENMGWNVAKKAVDQFLSLVLSKQKEKVHVRFHGGEPLLNYSLIEKVISYIDGQKLPVEIVYHINTNGVLLTNEMAYFFAKRNVHIEISMDGVKDIHDSVRAFANQKGSFEYADTAIKKLLDASVNLDKINIATTLTNKNFESLNQLIDYAKMIGIKEIEINTLLFPSMYDILDINKRVDALISARIYGLANGIKITGKWIKLLDRLMNKTVYNYCGRFGQQISVNAKGHIFLCTGYFEELGYIDELETFFQNPRYLNIALRGVGKIDECRFCPIEGSCAGGCAADVLVSYRGDLNKAESRECQFRKSIVEKLIYNIDRIISEDVPLEKVDSSYVPVL